MRALAAALLYVAAVGAAQADIRITESRFVDGNVVIAGVTAPDRTVTLDNKFTTKSDAGGYFKFSAHEKPFTCMSDIRSGGDIYSAVISGCLDPGDVNGPLPSKPAAKAPQ